MAKIKELLKKAWLPLVAVLAIGAGVALFSGAFRGAQDAENARQVTIEQSPANAAADELQSSVPEVTVVQDKYHVVDILDENSPSPPEGVLDYKEAASIAVGYVEAIFDTQIENCKVFAHYYKYEGMPEAVYLVSIDGEDVENCKYACGIDPVSGALHIAKSYAATGLSSRPTGGAADEELMEKAYNDPAVREVAFNLIHDHFLDGRTIEEIMVDGVQWTFGAYGQPGFDVQLDCKVRMSSGACYTVSVAYPDMSVLTLDVYPLGWDSCLWGYKTAAEQAGRSTPAPTPVGNEAGVTMAPQAESGWSKAEGVVDGAGAGYATPRPTPTPVPKAK
ncbi:MAG: hypothetical protein AAGU74_02740 [Bacillota bacterium]